MKLITQRELIRRVAIQWRHQYGKPEHMFNDLLHDGKSKRQIADQLDALNKETASPQDVAAIIGNASWTSLKCDECGADVEAVVQLGAQPDYESNTACLCIHCIKAAANIIL